MDDGYDAEVKKLEEELQGRAIILPTTPLKAFKRFCQDYTQECQARGAKISQAACDKEWDSLDKNIKEEYNRLAEREQQTYEKLQSLYNQITQGSKRLTGYHSFLAERQQYYSHDHSLEAQKKITQLWNSLSQEEKEVYNQKVRMPLHVEDYLMEYNRVLERYRQNSKQKPKLEFMKMEDMIQEEIDMIIGIRRIKNKKEYLVRMKGKTGKDAIWVPKKQLRKVKDMVRFFEQIYLKKDFEEEEANSSSGFSSTPLEKKAQSNDQEEEGEQVQRPQPQPPQSKSQQKPKQKLRNATPSPYSKMEEEQKKSDQEPLVEELSEDSEVKCRLQTNKKKEQPMTGHSLGQLGEKPQKSEEKQKKKLIERSVTDTKNEKKQNQKLNKATPTSVKQSQRQPSNLESLSVEKKTPKDTKFKDESSECRQPSERNERPISQMEKSVSASRSPNKISKKKLKLAKDEIKKTGQTRNLLTRSRSQSNNSKSQARAEPSNSSSSSHGDEDEREKKDQRVQDLIGRSKWKRSAHFQKKQYDLQEIIKKSLSSLKQGKKRFKEQDKPKEMLSKSREKEQQRGRSQSGAESMERKNDSRKVSQDLSFSKPVEQMKGSQSKKSNKEKTQIKTQKMQNKKESESRQKSASSEKKTRNQVQKQVPGIKKKPIRKIAVQGLLQQKNSRRERVKAEASKAKSTSKGRGKQPLVRQSPSAIDKIIKEGMEESEKALNTGKTSNVSSSSKSPKSRTQPKTRDKKVSKKTGSSQIKAAGLKKPQKAAKVRSVSNQSRSRSALKKDEEARQAGQKSAKTKAKHESQNRASVAQHLSRKKQRVGQKMKPRREFRKNANLSGPKTTTKKGRQAEIMFRGQKEGQSQKFNGKNIVDRKQVSVGKKVVKSRSSAKPGQKRFSKITSQKLGTKATQPIKIVKKAISKAKNSKRQK